MNTKATVLDIKVERRAISECVSALCHTILFHRCIPKVSCKRPGAYSFGSVGFQDVDCDFVDFTYVRCSSEQLRADVEKALNEFVGAMKTASDKDSGQVRLEFFETKKGWLRHEYVPWEQWIINVGISKYSVERDHQLTRLTSRDQLAALVETIVEAVNCPDYVPKMPQTEEELGLVFDVSYDDIMPYQFRIAHSVDGESSIVPLGGAVRKFIQGTFSYG